MSGSTRITPPAIVTEIELTSKDTGFTMASDSLIGSLLRTLVASKPAGSFLELGTGTGLGTAWMLAGMDGSSRLTSLDSNPQVSAIARRFLSSDPRVTFLITDGAAFIESSRRQGRTFDLIFADATPGKFTLLEETLSLLKLGGLYIISDLLFKPSWAQDHAEQVDRLIATFDKRTDVQVTRLDVSSGLIIAARVA